MIEVGRNTSNNEVTVNNHRFIRSKSPRFSSPFDRTCEDVKSQSRKENVSEKEVALLTKIKVLEDRILELHT